MRSTFRSLIEELFRHVCNKEYSAASDGNKDYFFLLLESVVAEMMHRRILNETRNHGFNHWSQLDTFTRALIEKIVNDAGILVPVVAFIKQRMVNAVKEDLKREPAVAKEIKSPPERFTSAFAGTSSYEKFKSKNLHSREHD